MKDPHEQIAEIQNKIKEETEAMFLAHKDYMLRHGRIIKLINDQADLLKHISHLVPVKEETYIGILYWIYGVSTRAINALQNNVRTDNAKEFIKLDIDSIQWRYGSKVGYKTIAEIHRFQQKLIEKLKEK